MSLSKGFKNIIMSSRELNMIFFSLKMLSCKKKVTAFLVFYNFFSFSECFGWSPSFFVIFFHEIFYVLSLIYICIFC
jgi:hypothetical protein